MYDTEENKDVCMNDNLFNFQQHHQHIHPKQKEQVLIIKNEKKLSLIENLTIKSLSCLKAPNQHNCCVIVLCCGSVFHQCFE